MFYYYSNQGCKVIFILILFKQIHPISGGFSRYL